MAQEEVSPRLEDAVVAEPWTIPEWTGWLGWHEDWIDLNLKMGPVRGMVLVHDAVAGLAIHPRMRGGGWLLNQWSITHVTSGNGVFQSPMKPMVAALAAYTLRDLVERSGDSWDVDEEDIGQVHASAANRVMRTLVWSDGTASGTIESHVSRFEALLKR